MAILRAFQDFPEEAALIGRMLAGYADLEIDLMHCARSVRDDLDLALKSMFRGRGNSQRIDIADALSRQPYNDLDLGPDFERAIGAARYCLKIRNLYAHCTWWNDSSGQLAFANLEELAKEHVLIQDLHGLTVHHVNVQHLQSQLAYFDHTDNLFIGLIHEGYRRSGKPSQSWQTIPEEIVRPSIYWGE